MPSCYTPHTGMSPHPTQCNFFPTWESCDTVGCCKPTGYDKGDFVQICSDGLMLVGESLVDNNCDNPILGATNTPPTWQLASLAEWLTRRGTIGVTTPKITGLKTAFINDVVTLDGVVGTTNDDMCEPTHLEWILPNGNTMAGDTIDVTHPKSGLYVVIAVTVDACANRSPPAVHIIDFKNPLEITPPVVVGDKQVIEGEEQTIVAIAGTVNDLDQMPVTIEWVLPDQSKSVDASQLVKGTKEGDVLVFNVKSVSKDGTKSDPTMFQITVAPAKDNNVLI